MPTRIKRICAAVTLAVAAATAVAPQAGAAPGRLVLQGCQRPADGPPVSGCTPLQGLGRTDELAISPDGRFAYASWRRALSTFSRDRRSGALAFVECVSAAASPPCRDIPGQLGVAGDIAIPRDGASLYFAAAGFNRFVGFRRDPLDGRLTVSFCRLSSYGASGDPPLPSDCPVGGFQEARQVETSRDGRAVYLSDLGCADNTGECYASVIGYRRNFATAALGFRDRSGPATYGAGPVALSRSGGQLYEVDSEYGTISTFGRVGAAGFKLIQCMWPRRDPHGPPCTMVPAMRKAEAIALAPNGRSVVTAIRLGKEGGGLAVFRRLRDGRLRFRRCLAPSGLAARLGCRSLRTPHGLSLARPEQLEFSPDGRSLYLAAGEASARFLVRFKLTPKRGRIAFAQCFTAVSGTPCRRVRKLRGLIELSLAGRFVYAITGDRYRAPGMDALVRFRSKRR